MSVTVRLCLVLFLAAARSGSAASVGKVVTEGADRGTQVGSQVINAVNNTVSAVTNVIDDAVNFGTNTASKVTNGIGDVAKNTIKNVTGVANSIIGVADKAVDSLGLAGRPLRPVLCNIKCGVNCGAKMAVAGINGAQTLTTGVLDALKTSVNFGTAATRNATSAGAALGQGALDRVISGFNRFRPGNTASNAN